MRDLTSMGYVPTKEQLKARCTTVSAWQLSKQTSALAPEHVWTNEDMDPVKPEDQTWTIWMWMGYWVTDALSLSTWETASSILALGLSWREAIPAIVVGTTCVAVAVVLNGAIGAKLHVPFSVVIRSSFGYYFAYFCICSRAVLAMFWLGIQSVSGSVCMTVMIQAIWPSYAKITNHIAIDQGITTQGMTSYFVFWIIQLPLLLIPPTRLRWLFIIKMVTTPIAALGTMGWCVHKAGGSGSIFAQEATVSGSTKAYLFLSSMSSVTGSWATLACNIPDFTRYARSDRGQYAQLPFLPIIFTACAVVGIVTTSAGALIFDGQLIWNPLYIIQSWIGYGSGGRAAAFFAASAWYIAQVGTNITANSISAANDLTVLFPRYVNIRRGCIIAAIIGCWVIVPWKILASANTFLAFMSGYSVFLAPIAGILAADYWLVKRGNIDVPSLYDPKGRYSYHYGVNWRALLAFLLALGPNLPGLADSIKASSGSGQGLNMSQGIKNLYTFDWLFGFVISIFVYTAASWVYPAKESLVMTTIYGHGVIETATSDVEGSSKQAENEKAHGNYTTGTSF